MSSESPTVDLSVLSDRKRRKIIPPSPTNYADTSRYAAVSVDLNMPSIPSFSRLTTVPLDKKVQEGRPSRRTESIDFDIPATNKILSKASHDVDEHCIEHSSFNKTQRPPFADSAKETDTFATFTAPDTSTFGTSLSFIGLEGLLEAVEDEEDATESNVQPSNLIRQNSAVGLDMDSKQDEFDMSFSTLSHPLAVTMGKCPSGLEMPQLHRGQ